MPVNYIHKIEIIPIECVYFDGTIESAKDAQKFFSAHGEAADIVISHTGEIALVQMHRGEVVTVLDEDHYIVSDKKRGADLFQCDVDSFNKLYQPSPDQPKVEFPKFPV